MAGVAKPYSRFLDGISPRTAAILCYVPVIGWIPAIIVLAAPKFQNDPAVRFHAFQGLYLFVVWLLVDWVVGPFFGVLPAHEPMRMVRSLLKTIVFITWILMLVKTSQNQMFRLPVLGELAEKSMSEQR